MFSTRSYPFAIPNTMKHGVVRRGDVPPPQCLTLHVPVMPLTLLAATWVANGRLSWEWEATVRMQWTLEFSRTTDTVASWTAQSTPAKSKVSAACAAPANEAMAAT